MIGFQVHDGGRSVAGYRGSAGDCVVRAFCILTGMDYLTSYAEFADAQAKYGKGKRQKRSARNGIHKNAYERVFKRHGLAKIKLGRGIKPTWNEAHELYGDCIVSTRKHIAAIVGGKLLDTHDERGYWWDPLMENVVGYDFDFRPECGHAISRRNSEKVSHPSDRAIWRERKAMSVWVIGE